jgi:hypothetical protein
MANPTIPVLNSPISGVRITDNTPSLSFVIPSDSNNDNLVFQIEFDTNNVIDVNSSDYKIFESRLSQGDWKYWNGSSFVDMSSAGVSFEFYGNDVIFTIPNINRLRNAIWYWRVSVSDNLTCCVFNNGVFSQNKFCSRILNFKSHPPFDSKDYDLSLQDANAILDVARGITKDKLDKIIKIQLPDYITTAGAYYENVIEFNVTQSGNTGGGAVAGITAGICICNEGDNVDQTVNQIGFAYNTLDWPGYPDGMALGNGSSVFIDYKATNIVSSITNFFGVKVKTDVTIGSQGIETTLGFFEYSVIAHVKVTNILNELEILLEDTISNVYELTPTIKFGVITINDPGVDSWDFVEDSLKLI